MKPRLKTSKKWTTFPGDYISQIEDVFKQAFGEKLKIYKMMIEGRIYTDEILLRVGLLEKGRLQQANFEVSMPYSRTKQDAQDRIHNCIDAAASMMNEWLETDGEAEFPRSWKEFEFEKKRLFVQFTTDNSELEAKANELLGVENVELLNEDEEAEDALEVAEEAHLDIDPDVVPTKPNKKTTLH